VIAGAGNDTITGGLLADSLSGGTGTDHFVYALVTESNSSNSDTITDFATGTDKIRVTLDYSTLSSNLTVNAVQLTAAAGTTAVQDRFSGSRGEAVYDTTNNALVINVNADNLVTTADYRIFVNAASTAANSIVAGDINNVITTGSGADTIVAGGGADTIDGGSGVDSITGGAGADVITGGAGADAIDVTAAGDVDTVVFSAGATASLADISTANGIDTITGFAVANDILIFSAIGGTTAGTVADINNAITTTLNQALTAGDNLLVLDDSVAGLLAADATALAALTTAFTNVTSGNLLVAYTTADNANARIALVTLTLGDISAAVDLAILVGIDVDNVTVGMFTMA